MQCSSRATVFNLDYKADVLKIHQNVKKTFLNGTVFQRAVREKIGTPVEGSPDTVLTIYVRQCNYSLKRRR